MNVCCFFCFSSRSPGQLTTSVDDVCADSILCTLLSCIRAFRMLPKTSKFNIDVVVDAMQTRESIVAHTVCIMMFVQLYTDIFHHRDGSMTNMMSGGGGRSPGTAQCACHLNSQFAVVIKPGLQFVTGSFFCIVMKQKVIVTICRRAAATTCPAQACNGSAQRQLWARLAEPGPDQPIRAIQPAGRTRRPPTGCTLQTSDR